MKKGPRENLSPFLPRNSLRGCLRISIFTQIAVIRKNKRSHVGDIEVCAYLRALFLRK